MKVFTSTLLIAVALGFAQSAQAGRGGGHGGGGHSGGGHSRGGHSGGGHSEPHLSAPHASHSHNSAPKPQHSSAPHQNGSTPANHASRSMTPQFSQPGYHRGSSGRSNDSNLASHKPSQTLNAGNLAYHPPASANRSTGLSSNTKIAAAPATSSTNPRSPASKTASVPTVTSTAATVSGTTAHGNRPTLTSTTSSPATTPSAKTATTATSPGTAAILPYSHAGAFLNAYGNNGYGYGNNGYGYGRHHNYSNYGRGYGRNYYGNNSNHFSQMIALNRLINALNQLRPGITPSPGMAYQLKNALMGVVHGYNRPPHQPVYQLAMHLTSVLPTRSRPYMNTGHLARELMMVMNAGNNGGMSTYAARNAASLIRSAGVNPQGTQIILNDLQMITSWNNRGNGMAMGGLAGIR